MDTLRFSRKKENVREPGKVITFLRNLIPPVACYAGCHDCCGPVPFTEWEWNQIPSEQSRLEGLVIEKIPVHHPLHGLKGRAIIPFKGEVAADARLDAVGLHSWMRLWQKGKSDKNCPFQGHQGCTIYPHRPILCRLFGAVADPRLTCSRGCKSIPQLSLINTLAIMHEWYSLLEINPRKMTKAERKRQKI